MSFYDVAVVLEAVVLTAAVTIGLTLFTFQTKHDFTGLASTLVAVLWLFIGVSFIMVIVHTLMSLSPCF